MGLDSTGFTPKSQEEIQEDITERLKLALGSDIDTSPSSRIGQFIDIVSNEIYSTWLGLQDIYNSAYPQTASGTSLDNVVAITNTARKVASASEAFVFLAGDATTVVPAASVLQKTGTTKNFATTSEKTIPDTSNLIVVSSVADAGDITLEWDSVAIAPIAFDDTPTTMKALIEAHADISDVTVSGNFNSLGSIHILFNADSLTSREVTIDDNSLTRSGSATVANGYFSIDEEVEVLATATGATTTPATTLTTIVSTVVGWSAVTNFTNGTSGADIESDAELRARRNLELQDSGTATNSGIKEHVQTVPGVSTVTIIENDTSVIDVEGREPHSYEIYIDGGLDDEVAQAIYDTKPAGINVVTTVAVPSQRTGAIVDVNNVSTTLTFSEPVAVPMLIVVTGTKDANYPADGDQQIKDSLVAFFLGFELNQDVLNHELYTPVNTVNGLITAVITQDTVAGGSPTAANTTIDVEEVATLVDANITITIV
jgi:uncharacterized phage protein gp47/JayE